MTKKIKRLKEFDITVNIKDDMFIRPPREAQRNMLLNKSVQEFSNDLLALDNQAKSFVSGSLDAGLDLDRTHAELTEEQIMEDWQIPIMEKMSQSICSNKGDILEIGFGRGISSSMIQSHDVNSHTIIECNSTVFESFENWKSGQAGENIKLVKGLWQETIQQLGLFDGIFFHTYPLNQEEYFKYVHGTVTFAAHFFETAARHLKPGGAFTYFSNEIDSLSRSHQRALFRHFSRLSLELVALELPEDIKDTWWADSMVIVKAIK